MARVVRPGGWVVVGDHLTDEDADAAAWHQEIERLRDPTHWASQTPARLRAMGEAAGPRARSTSGSADRARLSRNGWAAAPAARPPRR